MLEDAILEEESVIEEALPGQTFKKKAKLVDAEKAGRRDRTPGPN